MRILSVINVIFNLPSRNIPYQLGKLNGIAWTFKTLFRHALS